MNPKLNDESQTLQHLTTRRKATRIPTQQQTDYPHIDQETHMNEEKRMKMTRFTSLMAVKQGRQARKSASTANLLKETGAAGTGRRYHDRN